MKRAKEKGATKGLTGNYLEDGDDDDDSEDDATISIAKIKNKYKSNNAAQKGWSTVKCPIFLIVGSAHGSRNC